MTVIRAMDADKAIEEHMVALWLRDKSNVKDKFTIKIILFVLQFYLL